MCQKDMDRMSRNAFKLYWSKPCHGFWHPLMRNWLKWHGNIWKNGGSKSGPPSPLPRWKMKLVPSWHRRLQGMLPPHKKKAAAAQAYSQDTGVLVWAAGIGPRKIVKTMAQSLQQSDTRGLKVDEYLRVSGAKNVYAIGDAALSGLAPTAQVAAQQGKYIGRALRDGTEKPFVYQHAGSLCCLGTGNGIAQLTNNNNKIWEAIGASSSSSDNNKQQSFVTGTPAFALWRSLYWTRLLSTSSRFSLSMDWLRSLYSGRDVVEPVLKRTPTLSFGTPLQRNSSIRKTTVQANSPK
mmetsp:Transcript_20669/g.31077  ORF Transcript_20669/g.31077 Transcript_20669/m.31077 type:complete len:293 (+) Transcript_20669:785-1663(+)